MPVIADIVAVIAPSVAAPGENVIVDVRVANRSLDYEYVAVTGAVDATALSWQFDNLRLAPGETVTFRGWFTMPSRDVTITAWAWYWDGVKWVLDDTMTASIRLAVAEPKFGAFNLQDYSK